jgi:hypothetical protein
MFPLPDGLVVHRVGGGGVGILRPSPPELHLSPVGISVLTGGTPAEAMTAMRDQFPRSKKWRAATAVGSATVGAVRAAGFDVIADPTDRFPQHARLIHPAGAAGFVDRNLAALVAVFTDTLC